MATQMSRKRKFVADGVFYAELNEVLTRKCGKKHMTILCAHNLHLVVKKFEGEKGRRIRELTSVFQKRLKFPENSVDLYAEKVNNRGLCAIAQAESLRCNASRRACCPEV